MASPDIPSNNMKLATVGDLLGPKKEYLSLNGVTIDLRRMLDWQTTDHASMISAPDFG
jgi:hypothetical protein